MKFHPGYRGGRSEFSSGGASFSFGAMHTTSSGATDWAIIRLNSPLGEKYGYLGTQALPINDLLGKSVTLVGYNSDFMQAQSAGVHANCRFRGQRSDRMLKHDCDTSRGSSGSSIVSLVNDSPTIVGLNSAELRDGDTSQIGIPYSDATTNLAVSPAEFNAKLIELRNNDTDAEKRTTVFICNKSGTEKIYATMTYWEEASWTTRGWFGVESGACNEYFLPENYEYGVYAYAENAAGDVTWSGTSASFCVNKSDGFVHRSSDSMSCDAATSKRVQTTSLTVQKKKMNTWTVDP